MENVTKVFIIEINNNYINILIAENIKFAIIDFVCSYLRISIIHLTIYHFLIFQLNEHCTSLFRMLNELDKLSAGELYNVLPDYNTL